MILNILHICCTTSYVMFLGWYWATVESKEWLFHFLVHSSLIVFMRSSSISILIWYRILQSILFLFAFVVQWEEDSFVIRLFLFVLFMVLKLNRRWESRWIRALCSSINEMDCYHSISYHRFIVTIEMDRIIRNDWKRWIDSWWDSIDNRMREEWY